uniref:SNF2-related protein n=1 Tax=Pseudomonas sp. TaxID=306 RepID=UPI002583D61D
MLLILFKDLLKAQQLGLFASPTLVAPHVRKDGTLVHAHMRVVKKRPTVPLKGRITSAPRPHTPDLFATHDEPVVIGHTRDLFDSAPVARAAQPDLFAPTVEAPEPKAPEVKTPEPAPAAATDVKWFGTQEKADAWIGKKKLSDTHEVVAVGRRFEIHPVATVKQSLPVAPVVNSQMTTEVTTARQPGINYDGHFSPSSIAPFGVSAGVTKGERIRINGEARSLINRGGPFSDDERATLSQYSGNGGVGDSLNEFYTDTRVAAGMWKVLHDLGLPEGSTVLEPSAATGVFMHTAPDGVKVVGVELDGISSRIARALHGADHEVNNASLERFATQDDRQFDAVIGNPPFGLRGSLIKDDKPHLATAEQYFIDTALDKTKAGGVVALILPSGVMDSKTGRAFRQTILTKGEFIGAQRMPNTAFEHAHTGVTTDVLYLRKRPDDVAMALGTLNADQLRQVGVLNDEFLAGAYFTGTGAENVLGTMTEGWRAKAGMGNDITVEGSMQGVPEAIAAFKPAPVSVGPTMDDVLAVLPEGQARDRALSAAGKKAYAEARIGDTKVVDGVTYVLQGDPPRWNRMDDLMQKPSVADALPLAEDIDRLMNGQAVDRPALEAAVNAYVEAYGIPSKNKDLMLAAGADKKLYRLVGAIKPDGSLSDVVTGSTRKQEGTLDGAAQALAVEHGTFTPAELAERWGKGDADEALDHLYASKSYALLPDGNWTTTDAYLSGELWPKLDAARAATLNSDLSPIDRAKFEQQAQQLETVIDPASIDDVDIAVNQAWIPLSIISEYFTDKNANGNEWTKKLAPVEVTYADGIYTVSGGNEYGETKLLDTYLNRTGVRKDDKATLEAMNRDFKTWALTSGHRDELEDLYNRKFRGFAERTYSETPFEIPGLNAEGLKTYQYSGLRWAMDAGKGIIAADVGLGKTARGLILAKMAKADGKADRPMIVVPKSVLANWYAEAEKWFPGSRVLTIGESYSRDEDGKLIGKQDTVAERKRKYHDMTQNDYDFILISQPAFEEVDVSPALKNNYLADDFWVQRGDKLGNAGDKRIKKVRESYEQSVAGREFQDRTDAISFEDLGVDMLILDEGHAYKNLY